MTSESLKKFESLCVSGKHHVAGMFFWQGALKEAAMGDVDLANRLHDELDAVSPGGSFAIWVDGGRFTGREYVYKYDRTPEQISKLIGKAIHRARQAEEAA